MSYLPKVRFRVDWDNDSFLNGAVPSGTPPNLIPNAAYVAGAKAAYVIATAHFTDSEYKEIDDLGFTAFDVDFNTADKAVFGMRRTNEGFEVPVGETENFADFEDFRDINPDIYEVEGTSPPFPFKVYEAVTNRSANATANLPLIVVPAGEYMMQAWVRVNTPIVSSNVTVRGTINDNSTSYAQFTVPTTTAGVWTDWVRVAAVRTISDRGDGYGYANVKLNMNTSATTTLFKMQFGGIMLLPAAWRNIDFVNRTIASVSANATAVWNAGTSKYEIRRTVGGGSLEVRWFLENDLPRYLLIMKGAITTQLIGVNGGGAATGNADAYNASTGGSVIDNFTNLVYSATQTFTVIPTTYSSGAFADGTDLWLSITSSNTIIGEGVDVWDIDFNFLDLPNVYWNKGNKPATQSDIIMQAGNAYNFSFHANIAGVTPKDADIHIYGVSLVDGSLNELHTSSFIIGEERQRFTFTIPTLAEDYGLYVEVFQIDEDETVSFKAIQLTVGESAYAFNVGENAPLDDITGYVKAAQWKSGRNAFDDSIAYEGTLDLTLNNDGHEFSIANVDSPYYGLLRQNLKIVFEIQYNNAWYPLWAGWTRFFDVVAGTNSSREVTLHCEQGIYRLREGSFSYSPTEDTRMDDVVKAVINSSGWRSALSPFHTILSFDAILDINTYLQASDEIFSRIDRGKQNLSLVGMDWGRETTPDKALSDILQAEQAKLWIDRQGGLVLVNRNHLINAEDKFETDITLDTEVQDASYNFGEGIINRVQVMYQEKKEVINAVIWQSKAPIRIPKRDAVNIYRKSTVRFPLHFSFEEMRQRTITKLNTRISDFDIVVRNATNMEEVTSWQGQVWPSISSDGGNRIELQIRNNFDYPIEVDFTLYGNYLEGGQSQVVIVEDTDAQEFIQAVHEKIYETSVLSDLDTAISLAKWDISRYANPRGEFRVIETYADSPEVLQRLLTWELGTILKISEVVTGETDRFHIIIAEEGSYAAGDIVRVTHRMARGDDNYYNKVGLSTLRKGTLNHSPAINIVEAELFGSDGANVEKVSYLSEDKDDAIMILSERYGGIVWFGLPSAHEKFNVRIPVTHFANYSVPTNSSTQRLTYIGMFRSFYNKWMNTTYSTASTLDRAFAWAVSKGVNNSPSTWALMPQAAGKILRFGITMYDVNVTGSYTNVKFDADSANNLNSGTVGALSKTISQQFTTANTGESHNDAKRHVNLDFIIKVPANTGGIYARVSRLNTGGGSPVGTHNMTDPTMTDLSALKNTTLKEDTEYHVSLWGGAELGSSAEVEIVIVEHDTANEIIIPLTIGNYDKYADTFTTSASLTEPRCSVFMRIKSVNVPVYITGFAITESAVDSIEEANTRQDLAAYSFI